MIPLRLKAIISQSGKLVFSDTDILRGWLDRYAGKTVDVTFQPHKEDKTQPQLGYLFGHVIPQITEYTGYSEEEIYGILKFKFLKVSPCGNGYSDFEYVRSLADCSKEEVAKFIADCVRFGTEIGAEIYPSDKYGGLL